MDLHSLYVIGGSIAVIAIVIIAIISFVARNYVKVPPNKVAIFYGRKTKTKDGKVTGFKVVTGGAKFKIPLLENVTWLDLNVYSINLDVQSAPNKDGVPVNLSGVANVKIMSDEASLMAAAERFLGKEQDEIQDVAYKNLEGHLRAIAGTMTIEQLVGDRSKLNQAILSEAAADLKKMGFGVDLLTITKVADANGYIDQLGKKRTAEVVRDAQIGTAEAEKDSTIQTTTAQKDSKLKANENQVAIADSDKERDIKKATFKAEVDKQNATADQAGPLAKQLAEKGVLEAEQDKLKAQTEKKTEVAEKTAELTEKELLSTKIKPAEAEKKATIINAEAEKEKAVIDADGQQQSILKLAEAEKQKKTLEGEGEAAAIKAKGLAEAEAIKAKLLAEAEGVLKKAEAYAKLDETGKLLQILEVVERVLPSAIKEFAGVMKAAAEPMGNIKDIKIIDFGGHADGKGSAMTNFGQVAPEMVMKFFSALTAADIDPKDLLKRFGLNADKFLGTSEKKDEKTDTGAQNNEHEDK